MDKLFIDFKLRLQGVLSEFHRFLFDQIDWNERMIAITGTRGVGKTTLMLQYIKERFSKNTDVIYVSLDDLYFSQNSLKSFVENFVAIGGKYLFLDEVHKYPTWSVELKNIYDTYHNLHVIFSGSSLLQVFKGQADLSRRVTVYHLPELSFREFLAIKFNKIFQPLPLEQILSEHTDTALQITSKEKILAHWKEYLTQGAYPFFQETTNYQIRLKQIINQIFESDLISVESLSYQAIVKIKKLLYAIATSAPFKPNITKLAERMQIERNTLYKYIEILSQAGLIFKIYAPNRGISILTKPDKIFLHNPNLVYLLSETYPEIGTVRETFFANQLKVKHKVNVPKNNGDFLIDEKYLFEIGGKNKTRKQITGETNAFIAADDIEIGFGNKIPLWLFGFLY